MKKLVLALALSFTYACSSDSSDDPQAVVNDDDTPQAENSTVEADSTAQSNTIGPSAHLPFFCEGTGTGWGWEYGQSCIYRESATDAVTANDPAQTDQPTTPVEPEPITPTIATAESSQIDLTKFLHINLNCTRYGVTTGTPPDRYMTLAEDNTFTGWTWPSRPWSDIAGTWELTAGTGMIIDGAAYDVVFDVHLRGENHVCNDDATSIGGPEYLPFVAVDMECEVASVPATIYRMSLNTDGSIDIAANGVVTSHTGWWISDGWLYANDVKFQIATETALAGYTPTDLLHQCSLIQ